MAEGYEVVYSEEAEEDLNGILHFLLNKHGNTAARKAYLAIREKVERVSEMPEAYPLFRPGRIEVKRTYRFAVAMQRYRIIYTLVHQPATVRVIRIVYVRMDTGSFIKFLEEE